MRMVAIPLDKINYNKVSKYANVLIFKEFYRKTENVSYYLNILPGSFGFWNFFFKLRLICFSLALRAVLFYFITE